MLPRTSLILAALIAAGLSVSTRADDETDKSKQAAVTPSQADADFSIQGEYTGEIRTDEGPRKFGVQIIALGDGAFRAVAYGGGLPGDGWNRENKIEGDGKLTNGVATFTGEHASATVEDKVLVIRNLNEEVVGRLEKMKRKSPTMGAKPPKGATVLFDGSSVDHFPGARMTDDGLLMQGATSQQKFQNFSLHLEFMLSYMPYARGQGRSNSGCYLQGRYEVQILDSFGLAGKDNECGGIYTIRDPDVNMCFPPLSWQTYDIDFTAAKFDKYGGKSSNARMTVRHNGVAVHNNVEVHRTTPGAPLAKEGPAPGPIFLQDHSKPLRFRNIWVVAKSDEAADAEPDEEGFVSLFDGKTLNGWHTNPTNIGHGTGGRWAVEEGTIVGEQDPPGSGNGGILLTDRKFRDFELLIDMKPDWGVCSGLFVRGNDKGQCFQMMVDYHDKGNVGHIYGEGTGGFNNRPFDIDGIYNDKKQLTGLTTKPTDFKLPPAYSITGEKWVKAWKLNDWNTARVRVVGQPPHITTWINGVKVSEFDGNTFSGPKYNKGHVAQLLGPDGSIAVQVHGGKGWPKGAKCRWRNIRIKELSR